MGDIVDVFEKHGKKNLEGGGKHPPPMWIRVNASPVSTVDQHKHLGIILDSKGQCKIYYMTWPMEMKNFLEKNLLAPYEITAEKLTAPSSFT